MERIAKIIAIISSMYEVPRLSFIEKKTYNFNNYSKHTRYFLYLCNEYMKRPDSRISFAELLKLIHCTEKYFFHCCEMVERQKNKIPYVANEIHGIEKQIYKD